MCATSIFVFWIIFHPLVLSEAQTAVGNMRQSPDGLLPRIAIQFVRSPPASESVPPPAVPVPVPPPPPLSGGGGDVRGRRGAPRPPDGLLRRGGPTGIPMPPNADLQTTFLSIYRPRFKSQSSLFRWRFSCVCTAGRRGGGIPMPSDREGRPVSPTAPRPFGPEPATDRPASDCVLPPQSTRTPLPATLIPNYSCSSDFSHSHS